MCVSYPLWWDSCYNIIIVSDSITSKIQLLNESERIDEIARMLGGVKVTDKAIDHAKEILG